LDKVKPVLVLNKIDRLISELKLTPAEAYVHLNKLIDEVNGIVANLNMEEFVTEQDRLYTEVTFLAAYQSIIICTYLRRKPRN
jgi:ribosome assembly protein 1